VQLFQTTNCIRRLLEQKIEALIGHHPTESAARPRTDRSKVSFWNQFISAITKPDGAKDCTDGLTILLTQIYIFNLGKSHHNALLATLPAVSYQPHHFIAIIEFHIFSLF